MANESNLRPIRSEKEAREKGKKGGIASGKARREKADMRKLMDAMLTETVPRKDITYAQNLTKSLLTIAGDPKQGAAAVRAYETILRVIGQDEQEANQDALMVLKEILETNKKNADRLQSEQETT